MVILINPNVKTVPVCWYHDYCYSGHKCWGCLCNNGYRYRRIKIGLMKREIHYPFCTFDSNENSEWEFKSLDDRQFIWKEII